MLVRPCVQTLLAWSLIWANSNFFVDLGAGIPQDELVGDVSADRHAVGVEQRDAVGIRRVEPVIGLTEHHRAEEFHSRRRRKAVLVTITWSNWACTHCANRRVENSV